MSTHRLPVSGLQVVVQPPTGAEDLLLQETSTLDSSLLFQLLDRLVTVSHGTPKTWGELTITDLEALLLLLRRATLGNVIMAQTNCGSAKCGAKTDVSFRIDEYLASQTPRMPRGVEKMDAANTYRLAAENVTFRVPTGEDLRAIDRDAIGAREVFQRCVQPPDISAGLRRRIDRAMAAVAPRLSQTMNAECPECGAPMTFHFDVRKFVLRELRDHAASIFEDVHLIALHYKWPEDDILALPRSRRTHYAEALRGQWSVA